MKDKTNQKQMRMTPNFDYALEAFNLEDYEDANSLYCAVKYGRDDGPFEIMKPRGSSDHWVVTSTQSDLGLILLSSEAREAFLNVMDFRFGEEPGDTVELRYEFIRSMRKPD